MGDKYQSEVGNSLDMYPLSYVLQNQTPATSFPAINTFNANLCNVLLHTEVKNSSDLTFHYNTRRHRAPMQHPESAYT